MTILAGDIGGTKTVLSLYDVDNNSLTELRGASFPSQAHGSLEEILEGFLDQGERQALRAACFGVPGAVIDGKCKTTNLPWVLDEQVLARAVNAPRVKLLNDLEAAAYGMLHLQPAELHTLHAGKGPRRQGNVAVIAAGTGLGEGFLFWDGWRHHPIASEGGHCSFAPNDALQDELLKYLRKKLGGHVSWERVLSGPGLANVYAFLKDTGRGTESPRVRALMDDEDEGAVIGKEGVASTDPLCTQALDLFCTLYGSEAGNMALKMLAVGGIYVGGGIAPKIRPALERGAFMKAFVDKGRFQELLEGIDVRIALNAEAPLIGAAHYALRSQ